jgi:hypothetical protein
MGLERDTHLKIVIVVCQDIAYSFDKGDCTDAIIIALS